MNDIMTIDTFDKKVSFGEKLFSVRSARNLTLSELGKICNISNGYLSSIERDIDRPSMKSAIKIATGLGLSYEQFMVDVDESKSNNKEKTVTTPKVFDAKKFIFVRVPTDELPNLLSARGITFEKMNDGYYSLKFKMSEKMMALKFINEMLWSAGDV